MTSVSLLPKKVESFADSAYWRQFFSRRGQKAFEWYGSYEEIGRFLEKYLKPADRILQIGCGNSTLADDLYDNGFRRVISVDVVEDVIQQQMRKNRPVRPELDYHVIDVTAECDHEVMQASSYQTVLDKGTLDALLPTDFDREKELAVQRMFHQVDRILVPGGRYLIVTLAQPEVLRVWLQWFRERTYMLRVQQLNGGFDSETDWKLPTFLLVATKLRSTNGGRCMIPKVYEIMDYGGSAPRRLDDVDDLLGAVKSAQEYAVFCHKARTGDVGEEMRIDLHTSNSSVPRYTVFLTSGEKTGTFTLQYAVFIVPQGREHEWFFSSPKGRRDLCSQTSARQMAVVFLGRGHDFLNLDAVQGELDLRVMDFAPKSVAKTTSRVPYLSLSGDVGQRTEVFHGKSEFNGDFVVEEVSHEDDNEDGEFRRLVFLKSQNVIQSEARLQKRKKNRSPKGKTSIEGKTPIDWSHLCCHHHRAMVAAIAAYEGQDPFSVCLLGLGGGCLATYILKHHPQAVVTTVELDPVIVDTARKYFEFPDTSPRLNCIVGDALDHILGRDQSANGHYDVVLVDVAGDSHIDGLSCPLPAFIEDAFLEKLRRILEPNGVLALNLVTRDKEKAEEVVGTVKRHFPSFYCHAFRGDVNQALFGFCQMQDSWMQRFMGYMKKYVP